MSFSRHSSRQAAFTLIELLVVIAIIALLSAILFPVFAKARSNARRSVCQSNLKQMGMAVQQYTQDYDGILLPDYLTNFDNPKGQSWPLLLTPYTKSDQIYVCPAAGEKMAWGGDGAEWDACWGSDGTDGFSATNTPTGGLIQAPKRVCYSANYSVHRAPGLGSSPITEAALTAPSETVDIADGIWIDFDAGSYRRAARAGYPRHFDGVNLLFMDGHVKWLAGNAAAKKTARFEP